MDRRREPLMVFDEAATLTPEALDAAARALESGSALGRQPVQWVSRAELLEMFPPRPPWWRRALVALRRAF